jgi:hypothetical protein
MVKGCIWSRFSSPSVWPALAPIGSVVVSALGPDVLPSGCSRDR